MKRFNLFFPIYISACACVIGIGAWFRIDAMWISGLAFMGLPANTIVNKLWSSSEAKNVLAMLQALFQNALNKEKEAETVKTDLDLFKQAMRAYIDIQEQIQTKNITHEEAVQELTNIIPDPKKYQGDY